MAPLAPYIPPPLSLPVSICKRNEVNGAKNDRVRAVFVDEVKICDFRRGQILISAVRAQFWGDRPHFFSAAI